MLEPYEHAARIRPKDDFDRFRRESAIYRYGDGAAGIDLVIGIQIGAGEDNEDVELIQSVRAYAAEWPFAAFKSWLEANELPATAFIEAEEKPQPLEFSTRTYSIKGAELFAVGDYGAKGAYVLEDLEEVIRCCAETGYIPALKPGHISEEMIDALLGESAKGNPDAMQDLESSMPAFGWVENLRIKFEDVPSPTLVGDFVSLQEPIYNAIKSRGYDKVSIEILKNQDGTPVEFCGNEYGAILYAVGLLGHAPPEVAQLKPLHLATFTPQDLSSLGGTWSRPVNFASNLKTGASSPSKGQEEMNLKEQLEAKEKELQEQAAKVKELEAQVSKFSAGGENDPSKVAEMQATLKSQADELAAMREQFSAERSERIADRIAQKVASVQIPSLRRFATALYGIAMRDATKPIVFSAGDGDPKDTPMVEVLDAMFGAMNTDALKLFSEISNAGGNTREEGNTNARQLVHEKAKKFQAEMAEKGKAITFSEATREILDADSQLKAAYSGRGNLPGSNPKAPAAGDFKVIERS